MKEYRSITLQLVLKIILILNGNEMLPVLFVTYTFRSLLKLIDQAPGYNLAVLGIRTIFWIQIRILFFRPIRIWLLSDLDPNPNRFGFGSVLINGLKYCFQLFFGKYLLNVNSQLKFTLYNMFY